MLATERISVVGIGSKGVDTSEEGQDGSAAFTEEWGSRMTCGRAGSWVGVALRSSSRGAQLWLVACLVVVSFAVGVAWPAVGRAQSAPGDSIGGDPPAASVQEAEQRERELEEYRATPEQQRRRERSRTAFAGLSGVQARAVLGAELPWFAARRFPEGPALDADQRIVKYIGDDAMQVRDVDSGQRTVVESTLPVLSDVGSGADAPVDLDWQQSAGSFEPANPVLDYALDDDLTDGLRFRGGGFAVAPVGGGSRQGEHVDGKVFFANVAQDTDFVVTPAAIGAETAWILRSADSPEEVALQYTLDDGVSLREPADPASTDSAEIVRGDDVVGSTGSVYVTDADGVAVRVQTRVEGSQLVIEVPHRDRDLRYPLVVDPVIAGGFGYREDFFGASDRWLFGGTTNVPWYTAGGGTLYGQPGLYIGHRGDHAYSNGDFGKWVYFPPGSAYVWRFDTWSEHNYDNNTTQAVTGIWGINEGTWRSGQTWTSNIDLGGTYASGNGPSVFGYIGQHNEIHCTAPGCGQPTRSSSRSGDPALFQLQFVNPNNIASYSAWAKAYYGAVYLDDPDDPTITSPKLADGATTGTWYKSGTFKVTGSTTDGGLGVKTAVVSRNGQQVATLDRGCTGDAPTAPNPDNRCAGTAWTRTSTSPFFSYDVAAAGFPEGIVTMGLKTLDLNSHESAVATGTINVDRTAPVLTLAGTLNRGGLPMTSNTATLGVTAKDGDNAVNAPDSARRSGVELLRIQTRQLRSATNPTAGPSAYTTRYDDTAACTATVASCPKSTTWTFDRSQYDPGEVEVKVTASDKLGQTTVQSFSVIVTPGGTLTPFSKDLLGLEHWWTYESIATGADTNAHVNVANGNLVWHSTPVVNQGRGVSTVVNLTYNSLQRQRLPLLETPLEDVQPYSEVGQGFSMGISSLTRLNERLNVDLADLGRITLTDADGTRQLFTSSGANEVFTAPPGVELYLRRYSDPATGGAAGAYPKLNDNSRAWAATRPDGVTYFFDRRGYQTAMQDRDGNQLQFAYEYRGPTRDVCATAAGQDLLVQPGVDCVRKLVSVTDAGGRQLKLEYSPRTLASLPATMIPSGGTPANCVNGASESDACASGRLFKITDHVGRITTFGYDANGYLKTLSQATGVAGDERAFDFAYQAGTHSPTALLGLTDVTEPGHASTRETTHIAYQTTSLADTGLVFRKRVAGVWDRGEQRAGSSTPSRAFAYPSATQTSVTDARSQTTQYTLDARGRATQRIDARNTKTVISWDDASNNVGVLKDAVGDPSAETLTEMTYNANGLLLTSTDYPGGPGTTGRTTTLTYQDSDGRPSQMSPRKTGSVSIDAGRNFVSDINTITRPRNFATRFFYGPGGTPQIDPEHRGRITRRYDAEDNFVTMTYDDATGVLTSERDEVGNLTTYASHDASGLPRTITDGRGGQWRYCYDAVGNVTRASDPRATTHQCVPGGKRYSSEQNYDSFDRLTRKVTPKLTTSGRWITETYGYDPNGNLTGYTDGNGKLESRTYTPTDQLDRDTTPAVLHEGSGATTASEITDLDYDAEDNLTSVTSPKGVASSDPSDFKTDYAIDEIGDRVAATRRGAAGDTPLSTGYAYDPRGNVVGVADPKHTVLGPGTPQVDAQNEAYRRFTYQYDRVDNRTAEIEDPGAMALVTAYAYDANDNVQSVTDPRSKKTTYTYDKRDAPAESKDPLGKITQYKRRANGQLAAMTTPKGVATATADDFTTTYAYDANNWLSSRSIPTRAGQYGGLHAIIYDRNEVGDPTTITDGRGNDLHNTFLDSGELLTTDRPSWWTYDRNSGEVRERTPDEKVSGASGGLPSSEGFGDLGDVKAQPQPELLPRAGSTTLGYDNKLRLTNVTDAANAKATLDYDDVDRLTNLAQPLSFSDDQTASNDTFITRSFTYDLNGNLRRETDPTLVDTTYDYDGFDRLSKITAPGNSGRTSAISELGYDENGNVTARKTPRTLAGTRLTWTMGYDNADRLLTRTNPANETTTYTYDGAGNRLTTITPRGNTWSHAYTSRNELASTTAPAVGQQTLLPRTTDYDYDDNGNLELIDRPGANDRVVTTHEFDGRDLPWTETVGAATKRTTITEYDGNGNLRRRINPAGVNASKRPNNAWSGDDAKGTPTATENATAYVYDADDILTAIHLPHGDIDAADQVARDDSRWVQTFTPDTRGRIKEVRAPYLLGGRCDPDTTDPNCTTLTTYTRLDAGWIKSQTEPIRTDPDAGTPTSLTTALDYDYTKRGEQTLWQTHGTDNATRRIMRRSYWPDGTLKQRTGTEKGTDAGPSRTFDYSYNENGSLAQTIDRRSTADRTTKIAYDAAERQTIVDETWATGRDTVYGYDADGNIVNRRTDGDLATAGDASSFQGGKTTAFTFDPIGRETDMLVCPSGPAICDTSVSNRRTTTTGYYDGDYMKLRTRPNGVKEQRSFNDAGDLSSLSRTKPGAAAQTQNYAYDTDGNRKSDERGTHGFNARDQLVYWKRASDNRETRNALNGAGAIMTSTVTDPGQSAVSSAYCFDGDRVTSLWIGSGCGAGTRAATYRYDDNGFADLIAIDVANSSADTTYNYDVFGRMKSATGPAVGAGDDSSYTYDALDRRDQTTAGGSIFDNGYIGLTEALSREKTAANTRTYDYDSHLNRQGQSTQPTSGSATYRSYAFDGNGSVIGLEDANGDIGTNAYHYDPYGRQEETETNLSATAKDNPFRFEGFYYDGGISTYDMQARPYRPDLGRFLTEDRFEDATGDLALQSDPLSNNRYVFAAGNPVNNIEFDGHRVATENNPRPESPNHSTQSDRTRAEGTNRPDEAARNITASQAFGSKPEADPDVKQDIRVAHERTPAPPNKVERVILGGLSPLEAVVHPLKTADAVGDRAANTAKECGYNPLCIPGAVLYDTAKDTIDSCQQDAYFCAGQIGSAVIGARAGIARGPRLGVGAADSTASAYSAPRAVAANEAPTVVFSRSRGPGIAQNFDDAVANGAPTRLTRVDAATRDANRRAALRGQKPAPAGQSLDEYPFACSAQGGCDSFVRAVPRGEQSYQGGTLSRFFQDHGVEPGDPFNVMFSP